MINCSVILCTCNSARRVEGVVQALLQQKCTGPFEWELIVADFQSSDGTLQLVSELLLGKGVNLTILNIKRAGKSAALEEAFDAASGDFCCIIDDDNRVAQDFFEIASAVFYANPDVGVIGGFGRIVTDVELPQWFSSFEGVFATGSQSKSTGYQGRDRDWFWGAASVVSRAGWRKLRKAGFQFILSAHRPDGLTFGLGTTGGEDVELCLALQLAGYRLWYEPRLQYEHHIVGARLTENYLVKTTAATSMAVAVLRLYRRELYKKENPYSYLWFASFICTFIYYCVAWLRFELFAAGGQKEITVAVRRGTFRGIIRGIVMFQPRRRQIIKVLRGLSRAVSRT